MVEASGLKADVPHAPLPTSATVGAWVTTANAEGGQLDKANDAKRAVVGIGETCEKWQKEAVKKATKKPWWRIFG